MTPNEVDVFVNLSAAEWFTLAAADAAAAHRTACSPYVMTDAQRQEQRHAIARLGVFVAWAAAYTAAQAAVFPKRPT